MDRLFSIPLFTQKEIDIKIKILGKRISDRHKGDKTPVIFIGLLNGCFMFFSDLVKGVDIDIECDFMRVKSYVSKRKQGDIQITKDLETPIKGKHIYIIDDILDTGNTIDAVLEYLQVKNPSSISIVTLVTRKASPRPKHDFYYAFEVDDEWLIGYGMDDSKGHCRNYPVLYKV